MNLSVHALVVLVLCPPLLLLVLILVSVLVGSASGAVLARPPLIYCTIHSHGPYVSRACCPTANYCASTDTLYSQSSKNHSFHIQYSVILPANGPLSTPCSQARTPLICFYDALLSRSELC